MKKTILTILLLTILTTPVLGQKSGEMTLLTVAGEGEERRGGTADLQLQVRKGNGRIFIDSFPLTKLDTQLSTRFANEIVCKNYDLDCEKYDFFYTIKASSTIVGGPSAGAGIAALTTAVMKDLKFNDKVSITGTINSGGIIGPVAGTYEKVEAAQEKELDKVLIPKWVSFNKTQFKNQTGKELTIQVEKVGNIDEALYHFTGKKFEQREGKINISQRYLDRMEAVADILCDRTEKLQRQAREVNPNSSVGENFTQRKNRAFNQSKHYTAASYCFTENIDLKKQIVQSWSNEYKVERVSNLTRKITKLNQELEEQELATLSDLETYMIVKERLSDASNSIKEIDLANVSSQELGYTLERYFSAYAWSKFFGLGGKIYNVNKDHLQQACTKKISEAEERLDYAENIVPEALDNSRDELQRAKQDQQRGDYALCIFKSSKVKAEANAFLLGITVNMQEVPNIISEKLEATKRVILEQQEKGIFPILGYSYYEYADALKDQNPNSALIFSEYSLVMSNLDLYFPPQSKESFQMPDIDTNLLILFLSGLILGFAVGRFTKVVKVLNKE